MYVCVLVACALRLLRFKLHCSCVVCAKLHVLLLNNTCSLTLGVDLQVLCYMYMYVLTDLHVQVHFQFPFGLKKMPATQRKKFQMPTAHSLIQRCLRRDDQL